MQKLRPELADVLLGELHDGPGTEASAKKALRRWRSDQNDVNELLFWDLFRALPAGRKADLHATLEM